MVVIVGLGNHGDKYKNTRHNFGWRVLDELVKLHDPNAKWTNDVSSLSLSTTIIINSIKIKLLKPQNYMNQSGDSVSEFLRFYQLTPQDIIVIHDDLDLPVGTIRLTTNASSGGHNGVEHIITKLRTQLFTRLRLGIGKPIDDTPTDHYVLQPWSQSEEIIVKKVIDEATAWLGEIIQQSTNLTPSTKKITL